MNVKAIFCSGVVGTTVMTIFSYILSSKRKKNFKEPELLDIMIRRIPGIKEKETMLAGWLFHYTAGLSWTVVFAAVFGKLEKQPSLYNEVIFGLCGGIAAIFIWEGFFKLHPNPPRTDIREFYSQLIVAHLLFTVATGESYKRCKAA
jgi:hypothetical protein